MALNNVTTGIAAQAADIQQVVDLINGNSGGGQPVSLTQLSSPTLYCLDLRNRDTSVGPVLRGVKSDGTVLLQLDRSGLLVSPDGTAAAAAVSTTHAQTLTNKTLTAPAISAPTLTGIGKVTANSGRLQLSIATLAIAAAGTIAITDLGNIFTVSGSSGTVTTITATGLAGQVIVLYFSGSGVTLAHGTGNLRLDGNYVSLAGSTLELYCDGTNWIELGRAGVGGLSAKWIRSTSQSYADTNTSTFLWESASFQYGMTWPYTAGSGDDNGCIQPGVAGKYAAWGSVLWAANNTGRRLVLLDKNGSTVQELVTSRAAGAADSTVQSFYTELDLGATDYIRLRGSQDSGGALNALARTTLGLRRLSF